jgi:hypothetical protein
MNYSQRRGVGGIGRLVMPPQTSLQVLAFKVSCSFLDNQMPLQMTLDFLFYINLE